MICSSKDMVQCRSKLWYINIPSLAQLKGHKDKCSLKKISVRIREWWTNGFKFKIQNNIVLSCFLSFSTLSSYYYYCYRFSHYFLLSLLQNLMLSSTSGSKYIFHIISPSTAIIWIAQYVRVLHLMYQKVSAHTLEVLSFKLQC